MKEYTPEVISQSFIKQYYELFAKSPELLYKFYNEDSSFSHSEGSESDVTVKGVQSIRDYVNRLQLRGSLVDFSDGTIDAHRSVNNGVFLVVTGLFAKPGDTPKHFVQSFFLATQNASASFFVLNSIFRLLNSVPIEVSTTSIVQQFRNESVFETTSQTQITNLPEDDRIVDYNSADVIGVSLREHHITIHESENTILTSTEDYSVNVNETNEMTLLEDPVSHHLLASIQHVTTTTTVTSTVDVIETVPETIEVIVPVVAASGGKNRSFAELVKGWNLNDSTPNPEQTSAGHHRTHHHQPPQHATAPAPGQQTPKENNREHHKKGDGKKFNKHNKDKDGENAPSTEYIHRKNNNNSNGGVTVSESVGTGSVDGPRNYLFVDGIPVDTNEFDLIDSFQGYGEIKRIVINVNNKFACVEFIAGVDPIHRIIKDAQTGVANRGDGFNVKGQSVIVEERKDDITKLEKGGDGRKGYGRGRGGGRGGGEGRGENRGEGRGGGRGRTNKNHGDREKQNQGDRVKQNKEKPVPIPVAK